VANAEIIDLPKLQGKRGLFLRTSRQAPSEGVDEVEQEDIDLAEDLLRMLLPSKRNDIFLRSS